MAAVPAWRVHLGMPLCGARMVDGRLDAHVALAREDALRAYFAPLIHQAVDEFPAALAALHDQLPVVDAPISVLGASSGALVALQVLAEQQAPIRAVAPGQPGSAGPDRRRARRGAPRGGLPVDRRRPRDRRRAGLRRRAGDLANEPPLLLVSGEDDRPAVRTDVTDLAHALRERYAWPDDVEVTTVPDLAHPPGRRTRTRTGSPAPRDEGGRRDPDAVVPPPARVTDSPTGVLERGC